MQKNIIDAKDVRYIGEIPEFKNELPKGILNKKRADVGGTFAALNYSVHYIVVVPTISLIESLKADKNITYTIFDVKGDTKRKDFNSYIESHKIHKIIVTYDSFKKLINWLEQLNCTLIDYKVLIDEFHGLLEYYGFRQKAIDSLIQNVKKFDHTTYMSATPIDDIFIPKFLAKQPYTTIEWKKKNYLEILSFSNYNTIQTVFSIIGKFQSDSGLILGDINDDSTRVKELYIFVSSVKYIATIIKSLKLKSNDVKVVCSDNVRNVRLLKDAHASISNINDSNKKINFFTSKAFEGCNLFTNNGIAIVVTDNEYKSTLINLGSTLIQISGRFRNNNEFQNKFQNIVIHIFNTTTDIHSLIGKNTIKPFNQIKNKIAKNEKESRNIISIYKKLDGREKKTYREQIKGNEIYAIYNEETDEYQYSEMIVSYVNYLYRLYSEIYFDNESVYKFYDKNNFDNSIRNITGIKYENWVKINLAIKNNYKDLLLEYIVLRNEGVNLKYIKQYEKEYPQFKEAYDVLGPKGISSCNYSKTKIERKLNAYSEKNANKVIRNIYKNSDKDTFISGKDLKHRIINEYKKIGIDIKRIGFTNTKIIELCTQYKFIDKQLRINKKSTHGFIIKPDTYNYIIGLAS